jgi:hypothetical protein
MSRAFPCVEEILDYVPEGYDFARRSMDNNNNKEMSEYNNDNDTSFTSLQLLKVKEEELSQRRAAQHARHAAAAEKDASIMCLRASLDERRDPRDSAMGSPQPIVEKKEVSASSSSSNGPSVAGLSVHWQLNPVDPQLESAWFQPLSLSRERLVSKLAFRIQLVPLRPGGFFVLLADDPLPNRDPAEARQRFLRPQRL